MIARKLLFAIMWLALSAHAADGVPGATVTGDGTKPPYGRDGGMREACRVDPEKCRVEAQARREACQANPEKCRQERRAQFEKKCAQNPEKCWDVKARMEQRRAQCQADPAKCRQEFQARADQQFRKADADGNGTLSRAEAGKGGPRLARHFDVLDANKDGQLSREELETARIARQRAKTSGKS